MNAPVSPAASSSHLVLIPSYNTGDKLLDTVREARRFWNPVWVVIDGSSDGSGEKLAAFAAQDPAITVFTLPRNQGKGAAILEGLMQAAACSFTHVLTMDADGQHPADKIPEFMGVSLAHRDALVLGFPVFDASAPWIRVQGRKISNGWANLETLWQGIHDSLYGFRVYPMAPLAALMRRSPWMRRFDFDVEAAVRLAWSGLPLINLPAPVKYFRAEEGGVSHFKYVRDNALLTWMHARLFIGFLLRLPLLVYRRLIAASPQRSHSES
jgi:glycosyltransferase involved in cell wall biosynthesis